MNYWETIFLETLCFGATHNTMHQQQIQNFYATNTHKSVTVFPFKYETS